MEHKIFMLCKPNLLLFFNPPEVTEEGRLALGISHSPKNDLHHCPFIVPLLRIYFLTTY